MQASVGPKSCVYVGYERRVNFKKLFIRLQPIRNFMKTPIILNPNVRLFSNRADKRLNVYILVISTEGNTLPLSNLKVLPKSIYT
jgi:hypothetical protein